MSEFTDKQYDEFILKGKPMKYGFNFAINISSFSCMKSYHVALISLNMN